MIGLIGLVALTFILRLFSIQIINPRYKLSASSNSRHRQVEYPARGLIKDRNGEVLVYNQAAYDVMVIPRQVEPFDTLELCELLGIDRQALVLALQKARLFSSLRPSVVVDQLSPAEHARLQEKMYKFEGFYLQSRAQRAYTYQIAAHVLGYTGEVSRADLAEDSYYSSGDYAGVSGIEKQYESLLRGEKGVSFFLVDVFNRRQGAYEEGRFDTLPVPGKHITISLDADLQAYGERLMHKKRGSIVAIEPKTGEILAMVSSPSFDLSSLVGRKRNQSFARLQNDTLNPLFNRATMSRYAPGSIFKIVQALIGLEEGVVREHTGFACDKSLIGCHEHPEATDIKKAIQYSCNPYFYQVYKRLIQPGQFRSIFQDSEYGLQNWREHVISFGLGVSLPLDIPTVSGGFIPGPEFYDRWYGRHRWAFSTIYSNSNGQGEVESIPIQIANLAAVIANRGYYITPHFIRSVEGVDTLPAEYKQVHYTTVSPEYFDLAVEAMYDVVWEPFGTGRRARVEGISVCGKTGTVENVHGEDHAGFFAFAPMDNPVIALAVYVENAGGGGEWAAPIASLMIEKYIRGTVKQTEKEQRILDLELY